MKIASLYGNITNLKSLEKKQLLSLFRKKINTDFIISKDFLAYLTEVHNIINKNINLVINHRGKVDLIFIGEIWEVEDYTVLKFRDKRIENSKRLITISNRKNDFQKNEKVSLINSKFLNYLLIRRKNIDYNLFSICYKNDEKNSGNYWNINNYKDINILNEDSSWNFKPSKNIKKKVLRQNKSKEKVFLIGASISNKKEIESSMDELRELAQSIDLDVVGSNYQIKKQHDSKTLVGKGFLSDILLEAEYLGASKIIFNKELLPFQSKEISKLTYMKVSDKTELILEIFRKNAQSKEAHIQIELAKLKYELPRLAGTGKKYSQIGGGISTKGPGEKKIEQRRRYLRKRISLLEKQITLLGERRNQNRSKRDKNALFSATLIGYTCAGKSTFFNKLTKSNVIESTKPFSTLNPTTRRTYISDDLEILLSDTVGFITDLPEDLLSSFRATLEEIRQSDLLIQIVDCSEANFEEKIISVEDTLVKTKLIDHKRIIIFNKADLIPEETLKYIETKYQQPCVSSINNFGIQNAKIEIERIIKSHLKNKNVANL
ncbi:GTPase HflX [bacterium]|nr:GTPase HflX [bacterium]